MVCQAAHSVFGQTAVERSFGGSCAPDAVHYANGHDSRNTRN